jgi:hypothetical protein
VSLSAQTDPRTLPRFDPALITYAGQITIPDRDSAGNLLSYGAGAAGFSEDGTRLMVGCRQTASSTGQQDARGMLWTGTVPAIGGTSQEIAPCTGVPLSELEKITGFPGDTFPLLGGVIQKGGRIIANGYLTYDASGLGTPRKTWWVGPDLAHLSGPVEGSVRNGLVMRDISRIPPDWQTLLGGDLGVTTGYSSIVSRASYGPSFTTFWAKDAGAPGFPLNFLLGCPYRDPQTGDDLPQCIAHYGAPTDPGHYNGSEESAGLFIVPGTRTLIALVRESNGPTCYGYATRDKALHGTPYPSASNPSPENVPWCWSLSDPLNEKGPKGYPYVFLALLYDLTDLVDVKEGRKKPWNVQHYASYTLPTSTDNFRVGYTGSAAFNALTGLHYLFRELYPGGKVDVFGGFPKEGAAPPPPVDPCVTDPVLLSGIAWPGQTEGARSGRFVWSVATATATLTRALWEWGPQRLTVTDSRGCVATVTR